MWYFARIASLLLGIVFLGVLFAGYHGVAVQYTPQSAPVLCEQHAGSGSMCPTMLLGYVADWATLALVVVVGIFATAAITGRRLVLGRLSTAFCIQNLVRSHCAALAVVVRWLCTRARTYWVRPLQAQYASGLLKPRLYA